MNARSIIGAALAALVLAGCSGGGGSSVSLPHAASSTSSPSSAAVIRIAVPRQASATQSAHRAPAYISAGTSSLVLALSYGYPYTSALPQAYAHTFNVGTDCPVSGGYAICSVALSSLTPAPTGTSTSYVGVSAQAYSGANATGSLLSSTISGMSGPGSACYNSTIPTQATDAGCVVVLGGVVASMTYTQAAPIVAGAAANVAIETTFTDAAGYVLSDPASSGYASCLLGSQQQIGISTFLDDPHLAVSVSHPYETTGSSGGTSYAYCYGGDGFPTTAIDAPSDAVTISSDGTLETPSSISLAVVPSYVATGPATPWQSNPVLSFTPIIVPPNYVTIASPSAAAQNLTVTPPPTYSGPVSLDVSGCVLSSVSSTGSAASNAAPSALVSVSPASAISTAGSAVTFAVSPTGAGTGACTLTSTADGSQFGAVVAW